LGNKLLSQARKYAFIFGALFLSAPSTALASNNILLEAINVCADRAISRQLTTEALIESGWEVLPEDQLVKLGPFLADGWLLDIVAHPSTAKHNSVVASDPQTGSIPQLDFYYQSLMERVAENRVSLLFHPDLQPSILWVVDFESMDWMTVTVCELRSQRSPQSNALELSIDKWNQQLGNTFPRETDMTTSRRYSFHGDSIEDEMIKDGYLPQRPLPVPTDVDFFTHLSIESLDSQVFLERFKRPPNASLILKIGHKIPKKVRK
jgi:hypothetical protein